MRNKKGKKAVLMVQTLPASPQISLPCPALPHLPRDPLLAKVPLQIHLPLQFFFSFLL